MATINLGAIKFNWKGAYNSSTSYAVDDVVSSSGNSYVCIQAHSNQAVGNATAYWNIMSSAGTNGTDGTDLSTTLNNNEIAFKTNAGALDGIAIGTAGQALKVNSGANGYEFGAVAGGKVLQVVSAVIDSTSTQNQTSYTAVANHSLAITPSATSSKVLCFFNFNARSTGTANTFYTLARGSTLLNSNGLTILHDDNAGADTEVQCNLMFLDSPSSTSATTYNLYTKSAGSGDSCRVNNKGSDSVITLMEIGA